MTRDMRPTWDEYFLKIAADVATRANCSRRQVGAVIVKDNHILSTGYNGTPMNTTNCFDGGCPRCSGKTPSGKGLDECLCVHAEQNAICQAARYGLPVAGGKIYVTIWPCLTCAKLIINAGITEVIYGGDYSADIEPIKKMLSEAGVVLRRVDAESVRRERETDAFFEEHRINKLPDIYKFSVVDGRPATKAISGEILFDNRYGNEKFVKDWVLDHGLVLTGESMPHDDDHRKIICFETVKDDCFIKSDY